MEYGRITAAVLAAAVLVLPGQAALAKEAAAPAPAAAVQEVRSHWYESQGLKLRVPEAYAGLLVTELNPPEEGRFLAVAEKASVEAAQKEGAVDSGAGWIFSLARVTEEDLHRKLCEVMTGAELIAKDAEGGYYLYHHPTDVRYMRESPEAMKRDQEQWVKLNAWGWDYAHGDFIKDNNLIPVTADNSNIGIHLARFIYGPAEAYTLCKNEEVPVLADAGFSPLPYVEKLLYGASYRGTTGMQLRKFKYYTLVLPREGVQLDFFTGKDGESYVQEMHEGKTNYQYRITFEDKNVKAYDVMTKWLSDLKAYHEKAGTAATFEAASSWDKKK